MLFLVIFFVKLSTQFLAERNAQANSPVLFAIPRFGIRELNCLAALAWSPPLDFHPDLHCTYKLHIHIDIYIYIYA